MEENDSIAKTIQPPAIACTEIIDQVVKRKAKNKNNKLIS